MKILVDDFKVPGGPYGEILGRLIQPQQSLFESLPLVVFYHGWTNSAGEQVHFGMEIARQGFRVLMPDAYRHGKRRKGHALKPKLFLEVLQANLTEYPLLINHYRSTILDDFIGVAGMSMGGMTSCLLASLAPEIKALVSLMGTPQINRFIHDGLTQFPIEKGIDPQEFFQMVLSQYPLVFKNDLSLNPQRIAGRPFLIWHGENDQVVPFLLTDDFVKKNQDQGYAASLYYLHEKGDHKVPFNQIIRMGHFFQFIYQNKAPFKWEEMEKIILQQADDYYPESSW